MEAPSALRSAPPPTAGLLSASFVGLLCTQLLTAVNDNVFRWLVIGIGKDYVDKTQESVILMAGTTSFVLPYLVLAAPAGYLADRFSKRTVIVGCKIAEVLIMALGVVAIWVGNLPLLLVVVALTGAQSALFAPSKMGSIPELLPPSKISAANGLFGLMTVSATVVGMGLGNWLSDATGYRGQEGLWLSAAVLLGIALVGTAFSLLIRQLAAGNPHLAFPWNAVTKTWSDLRQLASNGPLFRVALGIVFFWSVGALAQLNVDQLADEGGALTESAKVPLLISLVFGVGVGSVLAGIWSGGHVELGILPLGAAGIALCAMLLFTVERTFIEPTTVWTAGFVTACVLLLGLGISAGLFSVPLESYLQHRSPPESRGAILAASNFLTFAGVTLMSLVFMGMRYPIFDPDWNQVPADIRGEIAAADRTTVQGAEQSFADAQRAGQQPQIEDYLDDVPDRLREPLLARLLWIEISAQRRQGQTVEDETYYERFPDNKAIVKAVADHTAPGPLLSARHVFLVAGMGTVPVLLYIVCLIPQASIRFLVWMLSRTIYRVRVRGLENLPERGGALLIPNHTSWIDGVLLLLASSRPIRMVVYAGNFERGFVRWLGNLWGVIPIGARPKEIARALKTAREALQQGELVCVFPEGAITRTGQLLPFKPGILRMVEGTQAPVIPVYLDGLWGSIFSYERGKFFWKWPKQWPYPVSIYFGTPVAAVDDVQPLRQSVQDLGAQAMQDRTRESTALLSQFVRSCKKRSRQRKVADSTGQDVTGGMLLMRTLILRRLLRRHVLDERESCVGLLLPPSAGGIIANMAVALDGRVPVNLNYTVSAGVMNACIEQAQIHHVLTSRKFMEKMNFELNAEIVYLDDFKDRVTTADKVVAGAQAFVLPAGWTIRRLGLDRISPENTATIIFTSGSTGTPKGVVLTYANIAHNVVAIEQVVRLQPSDVLIGILPFFHSFGYTVTMWTVASLNVGGAYHFNPLDGHQVGKLCQKYGGTILLTTPTFLRTYLRRCDKEQLKSLEVIVCGAEKLPLDLADSFEQKFGVRPVEGYGTTELSPLVSVNIPPSRSSKSGQTDLKEGTVGKPVPGVSAKVVDLDTGADLGANQPGMLLISGPNVMKGYLNRADLTAEVLRNGWYVTGDVALIDEDGFIKITGRESRFSKIGGEMVPHIRVEEVLNQILADDQDERMKAAVTAVPDPKKGERLVVLHLPVEKSIDELRKGLTDAGLPNLFIPGSDSFAQVPELPILGSGKLDLKRIKQMAMEHFG